MSPDDPNVPQVEAVARALDDLCEDHVRRVRERIGLIAELGRA